MCGVEEGSHAPFFDYRLGDSWKKASAANGLISFDYSRSRRVEKAAGKTKERNMACERPFHCFITERFEVCVVFGLFALVGEGRFFAFLTFFFC